jgi:hypothetical protein
VAGEGAKIPAAYVPAGGDRFRSQRDIHYTSTVIAIKASTRDTDGGLSVAEITTLEKGGPVRHVVRCRGRIRNRGGRGALRVGARRFATRGEKGGARVGTCWGGDRKIDRCLAARGPDRGVLRRTGEVGQQSGARGP